MADYHISQVGTYSDPPIWPNPGETIDQGGIIYTVHKLRMNRHDKGGIMDLEGPGGDRYRSVFSSRGAPSQIRWAGNWVVL